MNIALQLWALRHAAAHDLNDTFARVVGIGYDAFVTIIMHDWRSKSCPQRRTHTESHLAIPFPSNLLRKFARKDA